MEKISSDLLAEGVLIRLCLYPRHHKTSTCRGIGFCLFSLGQLIVLLIVVWGGRTGPNSLRLNIVALLIYPTSDMASSNGGRKQEKNKHPQKKRSNHAKPSICQTVPRIIRTAIRLDRSASNNTNLSSLVLCKSNQAQCPQDECCALGNQC